MRIHIQKIRICQLKYDIIKTSDGDPFISRKRILIHISLGHLYKTFFGRIRNIWNSCCLLKNVQRDIDKDPWKRILKTDPCPYLVKYSLVVLKKKTKISDIFNTNKKYFIKNNIKSSPQEIWIRIHFLELNGSPSLTKTLVCLP